MSGLLFSTDSLSGTPTTGTTEYNGTALYFTPSGTQRGVIPGQQMFVLGTAYTGTNATGAQSIFGLTNGVTLSSGTTYAFEADITLVKSAGTTSHTISFGFAGSTATLNNILYDIRVIFTSISLNTYIGSSNYQAVVSNTSSAVVTTGATAVAGLTWNGVVKGTVSINAGGTFNPQYTLSAAPGGAYTTQAGSYFLIYPIGVSGANVNIGTWS
jgi:hypothetical protein